VIADDDWVARRWGGQGGQDGCACAIKQISNLRHIAEFLSGVVLNILSYISYICSGRGASPCPQKERQLAFELAACSFFQAVDKGAVSELIGREVDGLPVGKH
jgi:hypothetical protein